MKQYIIPIVIALLPVVSFAAKPKYNTKPFDKCTVFEENEFHVIYQCPNNIDWIVDLKKNTPDVMFQSSPADLDLFNKFMNDTEHDFVEIPYVDLNKCKDGKFEVRVKITGPKISTKLEDIKGNESWAFSTCK